MFEVLSSFIEVILHLDKYLTNLVDQYGIWVYSLLFLIIFCETGLVFTPFLPGDSLLFAVGALGALGSINIIGIYLLLMMAAILGDTVNYWVGFSLGPKVFHERMRFLKQEYLIKTEQFYEIHGSKAIVLARFIPIIRTFAPFVAGIGKMNYGRFLVYNVVGGIAWVSLFLLGGYYFGNVPIVKENFSVVILVIILLSFIPVGIEFIKQRKRKIKPL
ncbi:MAG TPA: DedA family protein [Candidatus Nanoarchaeia archaeon]|nr:DedA family protein [Candidatus Nanoarchaeia archaeon]